MRIIILLCFLLSSFCSSAHDSNRAYFRLAQKGDTIFIDANFPWTLRDALILYQPALENANSTEDFFEALNSYVEENLILIDQTGKKLHYNGLNEIHSEGHSHQVSYQIKFKGGNLSQFQNTLMFNLNKDQVNLHNYQINNMKGELNTDLNNPIQSIEQSSHSKIWWLIILLIPLVYTIFRMRLK